MQLQSWLKNPNDFSMGLRLLDKYCPNKHVTFKSHARKYGENTFYRKKLIQLIKGLDIELTPVVEPKQIKPEHARKNLKLEKDSFPEDLQQLWDKRLALFKEAAHWHGKYLLLSEKQREAAVEKIMSNREQINTIWIQLDYYAINGKRMSEPKPITEVDLFEAQRRLNTLRTYKSRLRLAPDKWAKHEEEYNKMLAIVEEGQQNNRP